jgi:hypothetical protein
MRFSLAEREHNFCPHAFSEEGNFQAKDFYQ